ncbi:23S rRNA (uridine(2552)-2'-O)-methyltransferase RlmE [Fastidiosibacter lacustris]|uniref:23S rRNA (uridine(2552)-2'-O)-methyltransferase RlmE n=1 Tax=Fastidiosibacter lacustris TaxID=2056695 RepID=UPI000E344F07|nr:23S rRNA (uridine(2552)-2'-O)-methyltransferase RlmE [Fastidiosibacter lacustris]
MSKNKHSKSSKRWLDEHHNDYYVSQSKKEGFRSRAAYKLIELQEKDKLFKLGMQIVDLGAAPGGWSQVLTSFVGEKGKVFALDILEMDPLPDVVFIQGDFTQDESYEELMNLIKGQTVDWVVSDMAPNMSGNRSTDQANAMYLVELALDFAQSVLKPKGNFLAKVFQGEGFEMFVKNVQQQYQKVVIRKPDASRTRSREVYVIGFNKC